MAKSSKAPAKAGKPAKNANNAKKANKAKKGPLGHFSAGQRRSIYLANRIPMVVEALAQLGKEATELAGKLQDMDLSRDSPERANYVERLVFLTEYRPVLMKELEGLRDKRDKLPNKAAPD